jgi:hypothetical protein
MGMDVYGLAPKSPAGDYFRNNVWWWRPLWDYCEELAPELLAKVDGHTNSGDGLKTAKEAEMLGRILLVELNSGNTKAYRQKRDKELEALPKVKCDFCEGVGIVQVKEGWSDYVEGEVRFRDPCYKCDGKKEVDDWATNYPFNESNVQEFAEFLLNCGGFEIC